MLLKDRILTDLSPSMVPRVQQAEQISATGIK